jgi:gamma-glutamyltranspeptidase/glutathione hydrolase
MLGKVKKVTSLVITVSSMFFMLWAQPNAEGLPTSGHKMLIATNSKLATDIGEAIYARGGNVVDATIATAIALAVVAPYYGSFGGGGFAVVKMNGEIQVLDFREKAPKKSYPDMYEKNPKISSLTGGAASGVPGIVAGYFALHKKYGKLKWSELFTPTINLAKKGFNLSGEFVSSTDRAQKVFNPRAKKIFLANSEKPHLPGTHFTYNEQAELLKLVQKDWRNFYRGAVAKDIVSSLKVVGSVMEVSDLEDYAVRWLAPIKTSAFGYTFNLMPPPSSGGIVLAQALQVLDKIDAKKYLPLSSEELHHIAEVQKGAYRYRSLLGDPAFTKSNLLSLAEPKVAEQIAKEISSRSKTKLSPIEESKFWSKLESTETTHISALDKDGNAVAMTLTLNSNFGSGVSTDKFGIPMNNQMDDFTTSSAPNMFGLVQGKANKVEPGKTPLSSMSPTIVEKDGKTVLVVGGLGGPRIISGVLQTIYRRLVNKWDIDQSVQAPRVHHQFLPDELFVDDKKFSEDTLSALQKKGHKTTPNWMARIFAISLEDGILTGAGDSRGEMGVSGR